MYIFNLRLPPVLGLSFVLLLPHAISQAQNSQIKNVIITSRPVSVPEGKRWVISANNPVKIQVSRGSLESGTFCNAMFLSNPQIIRNINKGDYYRSESFGIIFKDAMKVPYTNEITYKITPIIFVDKKISLNELKNHPIQQLGISSIEFFPGDKLYVSNCLESIELTEIPMTRKEIQELERVNEKKAAENSKIENDEYERNKLLDSVYKKKKAEELKDKIFNKTSAGYFSGKILDNASEIEIFLDSSLLKSIYEYIKSDKSKTNENLKKSLKDYHYSDKSSYEKYLFLLDLYINREGKTYKVDFPTIETSKLDQSRLNKLGLLITSNYAGKVKYEEKLYPVNSKFQFGYEFSEEITDCRIRIVKNKKGEIKVLFNESTAINKKIISDEDILASLMNNAEINKLGKGEYSLSIARFFDVKMKITSRDNIVIRNNLDREIKFVTIDSIMKY